MKLAFDGDRLEAFEAMVREDRHFSADRYAWAANGLFGTVDLTGKRVLEVGSGGGLRSVFMALQGARSVVSLEPGLAGSRSSYKSGQQQRVDRLGLANVEFLDADFNLWEPGARQFDIIVSESSINHLYESPHHALHHEETYRTYRSICSKFHELLAPGGVACISDACRYALFSALRRFGVRRPWTRKRGSANWRIHQNPGVWSRILIDAGFVDVDVSYPLPHRLWMLGPLAANAASNFFLRGYFYIRAWR